MNEKTSCEKMNFFIFALCARPDDEHKAVLDKGKLDLLIGKSQFYYTSYCIISLK
jgi:hypothetical protein